MAGWKALLYEAMDERAVAYLREHAQVTQATALDEDTLIREVRDADAIIIRANGAVTRRIIEAAPRLRIIARHGVGVEAIDITAASERRIYVLNTPEANTEAVAEHTMAMLLMLAKRIGEAERALRAGCWGARYECIGFELQGRTLGLVGLGRIGRRVAEIGRALGMDLLYYDTFKNEAAEDQLRARRVDLDELLGAADAVTLHVPLLPSTRHLIGATQIDRMKPTAILVNTSRGAVVDTAALLAALQARRIAGAALDVFEEEPLPAESPLLTLGNVVLTPHMAAHTAEALYRMAMVAEDVVAVLEGRPPRHPVNGPF